MPATAAAVEMAERSPGWMGMDLNVMTKNSAMPRTKRAKARMEDICQQFGELECECVGIPELAPGRFVEVEELSSQADRKYYITYVRHVLDEDGYRTYLKAGVNSL